MQSETTIIGIGGAGAHFLQYMVCNSEIDIQMALIDSDKMILKHLSEKILKIEIPSEGHSPSACHKAAQNSQEKIAASLDGKKLVIIVSGLGGNTGSGIAPYVAELAKEYGICVVVMALIPFTFEGAKRSKMANESLLELANNSDCIFRFKNDIFISLAPKGTSFTGLMQKTHEYIYNYIDIITNIDAEILKEILNKNRLPTNVEVDIETESMLRNSISSQDS